MKKHFYLLTFFMLFITGSGFGQTTSYSFAEFTYVVPCVKAIRIHMQFGPNPEINGVMTINWGDGTTESYNYTTQGQQTMDYEFPHSYLLGNTYTIGLNVYSGINNADVDSGQSLLIDATDPGCGHPDILTMFPGPDIFYPTATYDFTGQDGITSTITPGNTPYESYTYPGLNVLNLPYTVSINDAWLTARGLIQVTPDFTITQFSYDGGSIPQQQTMEVGCGTTPSNPDLGVSVFYAWNFVAPLQTGSVHLSVCNYACSNTADATVSLSYPEGFVPDLTGMANASVNGNTLTFDVAGLSDCTSFNIPFTFPGNTPSGTQICFEATVSNPEDITPANNTQPFCALVLNSFDPNEKSVNQPMHLDPNNQETLQYMIHFQNDGNFDAMSVVVTDVIDTDLDLSSFQLLDADHGVITAIDPISRTVTFSFKNAFLVPSSLNLEASQGYVVYQIKENANLPIGTEIENTANIYFDFNPPIVTNTTYNINETLGVAELEAKTIFLSPNPATTIVRCYGVTALSAQVYDLAGKLVINADKMSNNELSIAELANGIYQVVIVTAAGIQTEKLVIRR